VAGGGHAMAGLGLRAMKPIVVLEASIRSREMKLRLTAPLVPM
jgi:hypothetical protein